MNTWPTEITQSRVTMANILLAGEIESLVHGLSDELLYEMIDAFNKAEAASIVFLALGSTIQQTENASKKLEALKKIKELRELLKDL